MPGALHNLFWSIPIECQWNSFGVWKARLSSNVPMSCIEIQSPIRTHDTLTARGRPCNRPFLGARCRGQAPRLSRAASIALTCPRGLEEEKRLKCVTTTNRIGTILPTCTILRNLVNRIKLYEGSVTQMTRKQTIADLILRGWKPQRLTISSPHNS